MTSYEQIAVLKGHNSTILGAKILKNGNLVSYCADKTAIIWDKDSYECIALIDKNNIDDYYKSLVVFDEILDSEDFIYANYFNDYYLNIIDKKTDEKLQWHSNYKPEVNALHNNSVAINENDNGKVLKVIS